MSLYVSFTETRKLTWIYQASSRMNMSSGIKPSCVVWFQRSRLRTLHHARRIEQSLLCYDRSSWLQDDSKTTGRLEPAGRTMLQRNLGQDVNGI